MFYLTSIIILVIGFLTFQRTFNLALFGDDWLAFWRYLYHLGPESTGRWNHLTYFLTPYGAQDIVMGLLQNVYGYYSPLYYQSSFFLRILAAFSLYPLINYLTKNKLASLFAVSFFLITTIGMDATNWVFNMPSYLTITLFNLSLFFFLRSREHKTFLFLGISAILYYLAYVITPIRMHGSLPLIFLLEIFWVLQKRNRQVTKAVSLRFLVFLAVFLIVRFTGESQGPPQETPERLMRGIIQGSQMLSQGKFDFLFYPIVTFGNMIIPDFMLPSVQIITKSKFISTIVIPVFPAYLILVFFLSRNIPVLRNVFFKKIFVLGVLWTAVVAFVNQGNVTSFSESRYIYSLLIGGYVASFIILVLVKLFQDKSATLLFLGITWAILSFLFAWWWAPTSIFPTTYRYLIVSAVGISAILAAIINLGGTRKQQITILSLLSIFIVVNLIATNKYISLLLRSHNQDTTKKIWTAIPYVPEVGKSREPVVFYFEGDGTNEDILHDVVTFGFPPHMALIYNFREGDHTPVPMSDFREVVSAAKDGKSFASYGFPQKSIALDRIHAFRLQGNENLINITNLIRERIQQILAENN